jgi:peptide/nickel transport system substrate-binding protein
MYHKGNLYRVFCVLVMLGMVVSACAQAATPAVEQSPEATTAPTPEPEKKIATFIWTQEFDTLNPYYTDMWFSTVTHQLWNCWAWNFDENNEAYPYLVTEMPSVENGGLSADGKTITLKLRDDIKWSDGEPITSADFAFTYKMIMDANNTVASTDPYDKVATLETPDAQTVVMTFNDTYAPWQGTLWKGLLPEHILQPVFDKDGNINQADWNSQPTVGCGPYVFAEWESGSYARFVVNENYWLDKPKIDEIFFRFVPDDASQVAALQAGDGDLGTFIAYSDVPTVQEAGITIVTVKSGYNEGWFFVINDNNGEPVLADKADSPIRDVRVRKAIAMAVDREAIVRDLLLGLTGVPASYWDALPYYNTPPLENYPYDPEAAKALLEEAGWVDSNNDGVREKDGKDLVVTYGTTIREIRQDTQAVVQEMLAQVGIKVELLTYEPDIFFAGLDDNGPAAAGDIDIMQWSDSSYFPDPDYYYWYCSEIPTADYPVGSNWQYYCNDELDSLFAQQATQVDPAERQKTFQRINQIFYDEVVWLSIWQDPDLWAIGSKLQNVKISGVTPFFNITEWDMTP